MGLSFTIAAGPRQRSHSRIRVPRDSWPHFTVSNSRFPQLGGPGPRIYIPQEQSGPVIPPGTGLPFRRLLRLAGLRRRYSNLPPRRKLPCIWRSVIIIIIIHVTLSRMGKPDSVEYPLTTAGQVLLRHMLNALFLLHCMCIQCICSGVKNNISTDSRTLSVETFTEERIAIHLL
jgi:hypothetical protein